jgi:hypothetical protein
LKEGRREEGEGKKEVKGARLLKCLLLERSLKKDINSDLYQAE